MSDSSALFDPIGRRKYLTALERTRFLKATRQTHQDVALFCQLLVFTGCRLSEALGVCVQHVDDAAGCIILRTLKRRRLIYRAVPVPMDYLKALRLYCKDLPQQQRLWPWCRQTGWRHVKQIMALAEITGGHASPKGLRHGFGIATAQSHVPPALTQRWMGHARLETTCIYQQAIGLEERNFAKRLWG